MDTLSDVLTPFYNHLKVLHILSVIAWMAGLLYLPRLFVYHVENKDNPAMAQVFSIMERRLLRGIMLPACLATFLSGGLLLCIPGVVSWSDGWMHLKLLLVLSMAAFHGMMKVFWRELAAERCQKSSGFFRLVNEIPFLLAIGIVILVVFKPF